MLRLKSPMSRVFSSTILRRFLHMRRSFAAVPVQTPLSVTGPARLSLCSLPSEILACILCLCEIADIFSCSIVCRSFEYLVRTNIYIRYKIMLDVNGMVDGPPSHIPISERLQQLKIYTFQSRNGPDAFIRAQGLPYWRISPENKDWKLSLSFSGSTSYIVTKPRLGLVEIISPASDLQSATSHWVVPLKLFPQGTVSAVSVDIVQDLLLVFQEGTDSSSVLRCSMPANISMTIASSHRQILVHARSLRKPDVGHPSAMLSVLHTLAPNPERVEGIQIHKERAAWSLSYDRGQSHDIEVWDWRSGVLVWRSRFHAQVSFALLDDSYIVAGCRGWNELRLYHVAAAATSTNATSTAGVTRDQSIRLRLPAGSKLERIQESSIPNAPPNVPFWPNPSLRMIAVSFDDITATSSKKQYRAGLLIPYETLRSILAVRTSGAHVHWDAWGPRNSLLLHVPSLLHHLDRNFAHSHAFGSRLAVSLSRHGWVPGGIAVIDINPYAARYSRNPHLRRTWQAGLPRYLDMKRYFGTDSAALPHVIHYVGEHGVHGNGIVAADPYGFTTVSAMTLAHFGHPSKGIKSYSVHTAVEGIRRY
ncbi:hypothetical protein OH76DRAFT_13229 [Lentinus brumalis]|uniref:F-box domain-containing protein n=1 Tax=Lentinus brumalis TaxID=2498619 RepID=A0A371DWZ5_9APHY|nr:hypothetical protein OH76DRAFT_13229 [Polyporus brumalis]